MSRIPYPTDAELDDDARAILAALPALNVVRMFAGAPAALRPLTDLGQAILLHSQLDPRLRQIAILSVAHATGSTYERAQHEEVSRAVGVSDAEIEAASDNQLEALPEDAQLGARFAAAIASDVSADEQLTTAVLELLGRRQATELVVCCAFYCAVARIIATCGVEVEDAVPTAGIDPQAWAAGETDSSSDETKEHRDDR